MLFGYNWFSDYNVVFFYKSIPTQKKRERKEMENYFMECKFAHCVTVKDSVQMNTF